MMGSLLCLLILLSIQCSSGYVKESNLFPFDEASGSSRLFFDYDLRKKVELQQPFKFLNVSHSTVFIAGHGVILFGSDTWKYHRLCKFNKTAIPAVHVFSGVSDDDKNATNSKLVVKQDKSPPSLAKVSVDVFKAFPDHKNIQLKWMLIVTWYNLRPWHEEYSGTNLRNTFQAILTSDGTRSFVLFYYNKIEWEDPHLHAEVGIFGGSNNTENSYIIPGSCNSTLMGRITEMSNIGEPGKFVFKVDTTVQHPTWTPPTPPTCPPSSPPPPSSSPLQLFSEISKYKKKVDNKILATAKVISNLGSQSISFTLPSQMAKMRFNNSDIACLFDSSHQTKGEVIQGNLQLISNRKQVSCPVPASLHLGRIGVQVEINYFEGLPISLKGHVWSQKPTDHPSKQLESSYKSELNQLTFSWNPSSLLVNARGDDATCQFRLVMMQMSRKTWKETGQVDSEICNTGKYNVSTQSFLNSFGNLSFAQLFISPTIFALKYNNETFNSNPIVSSDLLSSTTVLHGVMVNEQSREMPDYDLLCKQWYSNEDEEEDDISTNRLLSCPRTAALAEIDWRFVRVNPKFMLPMATSSVLFVQSIPTTKSNSGVQCAYNEVGNLMISPASGTLIHRFNPNGWKDGGRTKHFTQDTLPFLHCCRWGKSKEDNCRNYFEKKRGIPFKQQQYKEHSSIEFAHVWGAGHFYTFDGLGYDFNGAGEFWLMKYEDSGKWNTINEFSCQIRMEQYKKSAARQNEAANVSVVTALVMQQNLNGNKVSIQVSRNASKDFDVIFDGERVDELGALYHELVNVFINRTFPQVLIVFKNGVAFKIRDCGKGEPGINIIISAAGKLPNRRVGLLGNLDGDDENDLETPSGSVLPATASSRIIRQDFGLKWVVEKTASIFTYDQTSGSSSYQDFYKPDFQSEEPEIVAELSILSIFKYIKFCKNSKECLFDVLTTGSEIFARAGKASQQRFQDILKKSFLVVKECSYPIQSSSVAAAAAPVEVESLVEGSVIQMSCFVNNKTIFNVSFECVEHDNSTARWISQDTAVSLKSCNPNNPTKGGPSLNE